VSAGVLEQPSTPAAPPQDRPPLPDFVRRTRLRLLLGIVITLALAAWSIHSLGIRPARLSGIANLLQIVREAFPPDASLAKIALKAIFETLQIAFLGTLIGSLFALPLALLGSRNLFGPWITLPTRLLLAGIRTLPALLWAVIFVIAVGLGPLAGVLASAAYSIGYLGKLQYEAIEGMDPAALHAVGAAGASTAQLIRYVVLPESANHLLSQLLFMFEYNVRASAIFGFVGAGGIGFYIAGYLTVFRYQSVLTLLLAVFLTVIAIDYLSVKLRDRFLVPTHAPRRRVDDELPPAD
jgi:phosphonate transport system permease protein